jgi:hypothetical protein
VGRLTRRARPVLYPERSVQTDGELHREGSFGGSGRAVALYMCLVATYFSANSRPELLGIWRAEASDSTAKCPVLADHDEALDFMLAPP